MNIKMNKSYNWLLPGILAVIFCGLVPLSAYAQAGQDQASDLVAGTELEGRVYRWPLRLRLGAREHELFAPANGCSVY